MDNMDKKKTAGRGREFWTSLVAEFERTEGMTQSEFARRHQVNGSTFRYWRYILRKEKREQGEMVPMRFVEVTERSAPAGPPSRPTSTIVELGRIRLVLEALPDPAWLAELVVRTDGI